MERHILVAYGAQRIGEGLGLFVVVTFYFRFADDYADLKIIRVSLAQGFGTFYFTRSTLCFGIYYLLFPIRSFLPSLST